MKNSKNTLLALGLAGMLTAGVGLVGAQASTDTTPESATADTAITELAHRHGGFGRGLGGRGFGGRLALGTDVTYTFYDGDPEAEGTVVDTLSLTYGEDSELAFAEELAAAREGASFAVVQTGEQTRTLELSGVNLGEANDRRGGRLGFIGRGLNDGSTVTATFFDGDPEANGQTLATLRFTYGEDSAAGFADSFTDAAQNASFVTVTTSPQSYTSNLSARADRGESSGDRGFGGGRGRR